MKSKQPSSLQPPVSSLPRQQKRLETGDRRPEER
jgi:hypothetical protein